MKLTHHVPREAIRPTEPVTPSYQAEVDRSTERLSRDYARAQKLLARAEPSLQKARSKSVVRAAAGRRGRELAVAAELVELRREELQQLERVMHSVPASAAHRGRDSYRPVPQPGAGV